MTANFALTMLITLNLAMFVGTVWAIHIIGKDLGFWE